MNKAVEILKRERGQLQADIEFAGRFKAHRELVVEAIVRLANLDALIAEEEARN